MVTVNFERVGVFGRGGRGRLRVNSMNFTSHGRWGRKSANLQVVDELADVVATFQLPTSLQGEFSTSFQIPRSNTVLVIVGGRLWALDCATESARDLEGIFPWPAVLHMPNRNHAVVRSLYGLGVIYPDGAAYRTPCEFERGYDLTMKDEGLVNGISRKTGLQFSFDPVSRVLSGPGAHADEFDFLRYMEGDPDEKVNGERWDLP